MLGSTTGSPPWVCARDLSVRSAGKRNLLSSLRHPHLPCPVSPAAACTGQAKRSVMLTIIFDTQTGTLAWEASPESVVPK